MVLSSKSDWFGNIRGDILSGIVVALALIPEAIAFSMIAGVDPKIGLYASFAMAVTIAITGGRSAMISAATGAMALLMVNLVKEYGVQYLFAATILTGIFQYIAGYLRLEKLMSFVSQSVITGFVNALAILIFMAQLPELTGVTYHVYILTALGLGIIYLFPLVPKVGKILPSPLVCIISITAITQYLGIDVRTVGDIGKLPDTLPVFLIPKIPFTLETLKIILPYSLALAIVGLLESLMTATIVNEMTDTTCDQNRECKGQGLSNIIVGFLGGMAGCAMIGQSVINVKSGGRGRLSTLVAGIFLLIMVVFLSSWLKIIPMAALVAVMIMVSIGTFNWESIKNMKDHPITTNLVMLTTVVVVVYTHNLAFGVFAGVLLASVFFVNKIVNLLYVKRETINEESIYEVHGQVFFNSTEKFLNLFDYNENVKKVTIDLSKAHFWDITAVSALDKVVIKLKRSSKEVIVIGLNEASATIINKFAIYDKNIDMDKVVSGH